MPHDPYKALYLHIPFCVKRCGYCDFATKAIDCESEEIDRYTMDQAVADGLTVSIKYHPRIAKVLLDQEKVKQIEAYYRQCAE